MKLCLKCNLLQPPENFYPDLSRKSGRHSQCRSCKKAYREENKVRILELHNERLRKNPGKRREYAETFFNKQPGGGKFYRLNRKYGLSFEEFQRLFLDESCKICHKTGIPLKVDHCHKTGKIRGLLCQKCNSAIGMLDDSPGLCWGAAGYLNRAKSSVDESFCGDAGC